jgi:hypothetical protein
LTGGWGLVRGGGLSSTITKGLFGSPCRTVEKVPRSAQEAARSSAGIGLVREKSIANDVGECGIDR